MMDDGLHLARGEQDRGVTNQPDEFHYLPAQAADLGVALPTAERMTLTLPDGRELSALRYGATPPEITLLHGAGLNAHTWDTTALLLNRPTLAIDLAGHGASSWRDDADYSGRTLAEDIITALEGWTTHPQVLVGQSLGGLTATAVAAARPDLVASLVIVDITPGVDPNAGPSVLAEFYAQTDFASLDEAVDRAQAFGFGGSREDTERGTFFNTRVRDDGRIEWRHHFAHLASKALTTLPDTTDTAMLKAAHGWEDLSHVSVPTTLVRATKGFLSDADVDTFADRVPAATIVTVDATHNVQETAPAELATLISGLVR